MKTGELFALACELGASLAGAEPRETRALREYGMALGTAYQVYDDCLDLFGSEAEAGKSLGTDIASGKATLPVILLCEQADPEVAAQLGRMIEKWDAGQLNILRGWLSEFNTLEQSQSRLEALLADARDALGELRESDHRDALWKLTLFLAQQSAGLGVC
jgi:octaprenyl-diphosphate synthase